MSSAEQIDMMLQHVAEGERHVAQQREIVGRLRELGDDTQLAFRM